jgi:hypothetical protein
MKRRHSSTVLRYIKSTLTSKIMVLLKDHSWALGSRKSFPLPKNINVLPGLSRGVLIILFKIFQFKLTVGHVYSFENK